MTAILVSLLIGLVAGLRSMTAPAAVSWAARLGWLPLATTPLAFLGWWWTPWLFTLLAFGEMVADQRPSAPPRTRPGPLIGRLVSGALCGAAVAVGFNPALGAVAGALGAAVGAYGGLAVRTWLAASLGRDLPAALIEDATAVVGALALMVIASGPAVAKSAQTAPAAHSASFGLHASGLADHERDDGAGGRVPFHDPAWQVAA